MNISPSPTIKTLYSDLRGIRLYLDDFGVRYITCNKASFSPITAK